MREIFQLLFPEGCAGCFKSGEAFCPSCSQEWKSTIRTSIDGIDVTASALYSTSVAHIVLSAKEDNNRQSRMILAEAISRHIDPRSTLIPIPSSTAANRRRGYDHALLLTEAVAGLTSCRVWPALRANRRVKDQSGLSPAERFSNLHGAYSFHDGNAPRGSIVLIDDLVTTGASLREASRALHSAGIRPSGAVCACIASHRLPNTIAPY